MFINCIITTLRVLNSHRDQHVATHSLPLSLFSYIIIKSGVGAPIIQEVSRCDRKMLVDLILPLLVVSGGTTRK